MPEPIISPSVLSSDFGKLNAEVTRMIKSGAEWLHMDVMDGHFVPNLTIGPPVLKWVKKGVENVRMDCHMMVADPARWVDDVADAGGFSYTFHIEATKSEDEALAIIDKIRARGMRAAVAVSPKTPSTAITDRIGQAADMLLVMTVEPGKGGQKFMESCVPKVAQLRARFTDVDIEVDGGVSPANIHVCADAGSNVIVAGTSIFGSDRPEWVIGELKSAVHAGITKIRNNGGQPVCPESVKAAAQANGVPS